MTSKWLDALLHLVICVNISLLNLVIYRFFSFKTL